MKAGAYNPQTRQTFAAADYLRMHISHICTPLQSNDLMAVTK